MLRALLSRSDFFRLRKRGRDKWGHLVIGKLYGLSDIIEGNPRDVTAEEFDQRSSAHAERA